MVRSRGRDRDKYRAAGSLSPSPGKDSSPVDFNVLGNELGRAEHVLRKIHHCTFPLKKFLEGLFYPKKFHNFILSIKISDDLFNNFFSNFQQ